MLAKAASIFAKSKVYCLFSKPSYFYLSLWKKAQFAWDHLIAPNALSVMLVSSLTF
ncbi:hypothetical protein HMPREF3213_03040 [Heyndrickxia coagulans]|uniref:Uncharacterized protein n=1 Tax=Heyndrickxia coagulans TaxID=1398 RepID=A0A133KFP5_HEYCO|nr:hypothetical protein HMPREF3213_03040 [Heyndrickxia coagulans]